MLFGSGKVTRLELSGSQPSNKLPARVERRRSERSFFSLLGTRLPPFPSVKSAVLLLEKEEGEKPAGAKFLIPPPFIVA